MATRPPRPLRRMPRREWASCHCPGPAWPRAARGSACAPRGQRCDRRWRQRRGLRGLPSWNYHQKNVWNG
ncbi:unnamed protein product [Cladocopium goreaui]|uniref:Uncharacterized protein n=1 Tax=Cladocopium goreaui TaxID=2562237 RepID=A0A9P1DUD4_9DINO|nr:unnamed protein product [Cladocopium goreaui]